MKHSNVQTSTVTGSSQALISTMKADRTYIVTSTCDCWIKEGGDASVSGSDCILVPGGVPYPYTALAATSLNVIKDTDSSNGRATLSQVSA